MGIFDKILKKNKEAEEPSLKKERKVAAVEKKSEKPAAKKQEKKPEPKKSPVSSKSKRAKKEENLAYKFLFEPIISEKSTQMNQFNKYVFRVDKKSGKNQIKEAVEGYYGVNVLKVNVIKISPKKRISGRTVGYKKGFKKAIVTLQEGDAIGIVEGV